MPHDSNKVYVSEQYGVSTDDVASVLGVTSHDVVTLCTSERINMWSKYKPVKRADINPYSDSNWWKGDNNAFPCGIKPKVFEDEDRKSLSNIASYFTEDKMNGWEYQRLEEGDCCRLADFNGYNHKALPPFGSIGVFNESNWGTKMYAQLAVNMHSADNDGESGTEITFEMLLGKLGESFVHPVFVIGNKLIQYNIQDSLNQKYIRASFDVNEGDEYTLYPLFYVSNSETPDDTLAFNQRTLYTCVGVSPITSVARANLQFNYTVYQPKGEDTEKTLYVKLTVTNNSSYSITMNECYIWLRTSVDYISDLITNVEQELLPLQSVIVPHDDDTNTVVLYEGYVILKQAMDIKDAHLLVSLDNGNMRMDVPIMRQNDDKEVSS